MGLTNGQIALLVERIYTATNHSAPTVAQLETWRDAIKNLDWDVALDAAKQIITTEERTPSIARFLSYVEQRVGGAVPTAEQAITEVLAEIARVGRYLPPVWSHGAIGRAVATIGWGDICASENDYWKTQFMKAYANISRQDVTATRLELTSVRLGLDTSELFVSELAQ